MRTNWMAGSLLVVAANALVAPAMGSEASPPSIDDALAAIAAYGPRALQEQGAPGMSVAITDRTHTLKILTFGYANVDAKSPVTEQTRFWIYSITKSMTALALLEQHDAGKVDLQAPVQRYLPWFSIHSNGKPILVHELLSHTAGLPTYYSSANTFTFGVTALRSAHVLFTPGTSWSYSNLGYITLGEILATLTQRPWQDAIAAGVFGPIGMTDTDAYSTPSSTTGAAVGYGYRDYDRAMPPVDAPLIAIVPFSDYIDPAGSVISTPEDMARYIRFYLNGGQTETGRQLLAPATFAAMTSPDRLANGKPAGAKEVELAEWPDFYRQYGYGLSVFNTDGDRLIGHTGGGGGYTACMQANLTRGFGAIAMSNLSEEPLHPCAIVRYAMAVLHAQNLGQPLPPAPSPPPDPAIVKNAPQYAGTFSNNSSSLRVEFDGERLTLNDDGKTYRLLAGDTDQFWTDDPKFSIFYLLFGRNKAKAVDEVRYGPLLFTNDRYTGLRVFAHPARYDALIGRYETVNGNITRVVLVKGRLTFDGEEPLVDREDGTFVSDGSIVRFDTLAAGRMQRMWIDDIDAYRVDLP
jgi:CubicO group peptidase (beta-lactamase class C family)